MSALKRPKRDNTKTVSFSDEEDADGDPSIDRIVACSDNHTTCVNDKIDALKEVLDENTCLDLLVGYYQILSEFMQRSIMANMGLIVGSCCFLPKNY